MRHFLHFASGLSLILIVSVTISCDHNKNKTNKKYLEEVEDWHSERVASLKEKDSWLSLVGLYELSEGTQTFGSDSTNDIIFPPQAPAKIGSIRKQKDKVTATVLPDVAVTHNGDPVSEIELASEQIELQHNTLQWNVIERRGNYYIRLRDIEHPHLASFEGVERFPLSEKWRVKATFNAFEEAQSIFVPDVMNEGMQDSLYGTLKFTVGGQEYTLAPLGDPEKDKKFFIIFGDKTNGEATYSGGRYIYIPTPGENGITDLDFNKAYNPPCVFTPFATCPLPPARNRLDLKVTAGEKMYGE